MPVIALCLALIFVLPPLARTWRGLGFLTLAALVPAGMMAWDAVTATDAMGRGMSTGLAIVAAIMALAGASARLLSLAAERAGQPRPRSLWIEAGIFLICAGGLTGLAAANIL
ncbi:hypothetical protein FDP22_03425 [Paroceanicella profunda]|uniref:Uncharacterized protein n=1 Tax=Paroceanicella profunda TaxID=2579971 RepID=A0A5B8FWN9_9RHOB|nr:hypothetical protein [Paroceanicella profunda]QDL90919.1 hypothetical protein FDP22_03425 [Paroceanicella profunda]